MDSISVFDCTTPSCTNAIRRPLPPGEALHMALFGKELVQYLVMDAHHAFDCGVFSSFLGPWIMDGLVMHNRHTHTHTSHTHTLTSVDTLIIWQRAGSWFTHTFVLREYSSRACILKKSSVLILWTWDMNQYKQICLSYLTQAHAHVHAIFRTCAYVDANADRHTMTHNAIKTT